MAQLLQRPLRCKLHWALLLHDGASTAPHAAHTQIPHGNLRLAGRARPLKEGVVHLHHRQLVHCLRELLLLSLAKVSSISASCSHARWPQRLSNRLRHLAPPNHVKVWPRWRCDLHWLRCRNLPSSVLCKLSRRRTLHRRQKKTRRFSRSRSPHVLCFSSQNAQTSSATKW